MEYPIYITRSGRLGFYDQHPYIAKLVCVLKGH